MTDMLEKVAQAAPQWEVLWGDLRILVDPDGNVWVSDSGPIYGMLVHSGGIVDKRLARAMMMHAALWTNGESYRPWERRPPLLR